MKVLYVICIKERKNKSKFNEYILCTATSLAVADNIVDVLNECLSKDYERDVIEESEV